MKYTQLSIINLSASISLLFLAVDNDTMWSDRSEICLYIDIEIVIAFLDNKYTNFIYSNYLSKKISIYNLISK